MVAGRKFTVLRHEIFDWLISNLLRQTHRCTTRTVALDCAEQLDRRGGLVTAGSTRPINEVEYVVDMGRSPSTSVLIRTKNEASHLASTLEAVFDQSVPVHEILVIDSGSTDRTLEVAARYPVKILTIDPEEWSYSRALNMAAAQATGNVLVCLSAHCIPATRDWMHYLVRHFDDPSVAGVWGPGLRPGRSAPALEHPEHQMPGMYNVSTRMWGLSNANSALRRELWMEFPFDEAMPAAEDKAWGKEAMDRGYCIVYEPGAAVWHESHSFARAYHRNRAVMEGLRMMFPELGNVRSDQLRAVRRAAWRTFMFHTRNRRLGTLLRDVGRIPSTFAAVSGVFLADLARDFRQWRERRAEGG